MAKTASKSKTAPKSPGPKTRSKSNPRNKTKKQICITLLKRSTGASLAELQKATGWQPHSVRGFLSGTVKKLSGVTLVIEADFGGVRRYRIKTEKAS